MKKGCLMVCLLLLLGSLSACGYSDLERQIYPIVMSLDESDEGLIILGVQAPQSTPQGDEPMYDRLVVMGESYENALSLLASVTPYPLNFSQLRQVIVGESMARHQDLRQLTGKLLSQPSMRPDARLMIALGSAEHVMNSQTPDLGMRLSTHLTLLFERLRRENLLPESTLSSFHRLSGSLRGDTLVCICAVNEMLLENLKKQEDKAAFSSVSRAGDRLPEEDMIAGLLPHKGRNPVEYLGSAAMHQGHLTGFLTARETQLTLRMLKEGRRKTALNDGVQLQIRLDKNSPLSRELSDCQQVFEKLRSLECDVFSFGGRCAGAFWTTQAWKAFDFPKRYRTASLIVHAE